MSKIVHQNHHQLTFDDSGYSSPIYPENTSQPLPNIEAQCALGDYLEDSERKGVSVTRAMIRKKAAIFAANAWLEEDQKRINAPTIEGNSGGGIGHSSLTRPEGMPSQRRALDRLSQQRAEFSLPLYWLKLLQMARIRLLTLSSDLYKQTVSRDGFDQSLLRTEISSQTAILSSFRSMLFPRTKEAKSIDRLIV